MANNKELLYEFLGNEGYRPKTDGDGDIVFKYEGDSYLLIFKEDDEDYVSLNKYIGIEFGEDKSLDVYKLLNKINSRYIVGKATIHEREDQTLGLQVEYLGSMDEFKRFFERFLNLLRHMEEEFVEELVERIL